MNLLFISKNIKTYDDYPIYAKTINNNTTLVYIVRRFVGPEGAYGIGCHL